MVGIRSAIYFSFMVVTGSVWGLLSALARVLPVRPRFTFISQWAILNVAMLKVICGLGYRVEGRENVPKEPCVILSKHQSTWETMIMQLLFPPVTWVLKKSLIRIPFFGWGLAALDPVAIDRQARKQALEQVIEQGKDRLTRGWNIVIFPEGTRMAPGVMGKFKLGGARLAVESGRLVVPVAHNAGEFWPRHGFKKHPGTITVVIGEPFDPSGMSPDEVNKRVYDFIETQMKRITTLPQKNEPEQSSLQQTATD